MLKRFFHLFLVGMLIFSSLGNSLPAFAQFESPPIDIEEEKADPPNPEESDFPDEEESDFPDEEESDLPDSEESDLPDEEESSMEIEEFFVESEIEIMSTYSDIIPLQDGPSPLYVYVSKISNAKCSIAENAIFANVCDAININEPNTTQLQRLCGI